MRALISVVAIAGATGCGQQVDHPKAAADCDPSTMKCFSGSLESGSGSGGSSSQGGSSAGSSETLAKLDGRVVGFSDDFFDRSAAFNGQASVAADGRSGSRVEASYDGTSFELAGVLKTAANWFLTEPAGNSGFLPTLVAVDTRATTSDQLLVAVTPTLVIDGILQSLGSSTSTDRAQVVLHVVDDQGRSVTGVTASLSAELVAYRTAGVWLSTGASTDDSGLVLIGNATASSTVTHASVNLGGATSARIEVAIRAGTTTVVSAVVTPK
jgi:hypothetical protein